MHPDEPRPHVEFLDAATAADPDEGEALDTASRPIRRVWWGLGAAVVAAAVVVVLVQHHSSSPEPVAVPTTSTVPVPTPTPSFRNVDVLGPGSLRISDPSRCPAKIPCVVEGNSSVALTSAVFDAFPGGRLVSIRTVRSVATHRVWYRQLVVIAGPVRVLVELSRSGLQDGQTRAQTTDTMAFVREVVNGLLTQIRSDGPKDRLPSTDQLFALAEDARLTK